jgi:hypothetical protein
MSDIERYITIASLINALIFYLITIVVFLIARKTALNKALAIQKGIWVLIILLVALPAYVASVEVLPGHVRAVLWLALSLVTWWVLYEVYRANWHHGWRAFAHHLWCETKRLPARALGKDAPKC